MRKGQLITHMEGNIPSLPTRITVYTSDMRQVGFQYDKPWETTVIDAVDNRGRPEFEDYTFHARDLEERTLHHYHVVGELQKSGYKLISHQDDFKEREINEEYEALIGDLKKIRAALGEQRNKKAWDKRLEGIPLLDLFSSTQEELNRLEFLRYLKNQGLV